MNLFQLSKLSGFSLLALIILSHGCGEYLEYPIGTECYQGDDLSLAKDKALIITPNFKLSGAWRLKVDQHKLNCVSSPVGDDYNFEYKALRSRVFFLETGENQINYMPSTEEGMKDEEELTNIGLWVENKPLVLELPFKNDDLSEGSLKVDTLKLYVRDFRIVMGELSGEAHYMFNEEITMIGQFTLNQVANN